MAKNSGKNTVFFVGVLIFSLTVFLEHLFWGETDITCFMKGLSVGIQIVGIVILIKNNKSHK